MKACAGKLENVMEICIKCLIAQKYFDCQWLFLEVHAFIVAKRSGNATWGQKEAKTECLILSFEAYFQERRIKTLKQAANISKLFVMLAGIEKQKMKSPWREGEIEMCKTVVFQVIWRHYCHKII